VFNYKEDKIIKYLCVPVMKEPVECLEWAEIISTCVENLLAFGSNNGNIFLYSLDKLELKVIINKGFKYVIKLIHLFLSRWSE
jgi:hypothetical protein